MMLPLLLAKENHSVIHLCLLSVMRVTHQKMRQNLKRLIHSLKRLPLALTVAESVPQPGPSTSQSTLAQPADSWNGFVIVADNIDKNVRASFQRVDYTTKSIHHVNTYAVKDCINLAHLSDLPPPQQLDVQSLLPSDEDHPVIQNEFEVLVFR